MPSHTPHDSREDPSSPAFSERYDEDAIPRNQHTKRKPYVTENLGKRGEYIREDHVREVDRTVPG
jgi:hypothetical protein